MSSTHKSPHLNDDWYASVYALPDVASKVEEPDMQASTHESSEETSTKTPVTPRNKA